MMKILSEAEKKRKFRGGKPNKLSLEDRLIIVLVEFMSDCVSLKKTRLEEV